MKLKDLLEDQSQNLDIKVTHGDWNSPRVFIEAALRPDRDPTPDWLKNKNNPAIVEVTVDLSRDRQEGHLNHIISHRKGQGYGPEVLRWIMIQLKKHGFKKVTGYIENSNSSSKAMVGKVGFKQVRQEKDGSYWEVDL